MHGLFLRLTCWLLSIKLILTKESFLMVNFLFVQEISFSPETVLQKQIVMKGYDLKILVVLINSIIPNASFLNSL